MSVKCKIEEVRGGVKALTRGVWCAAGALVRPMDLSAAIVEYMDRIRGLDQVHHSCSALFLLVPLPFTTSSLAKP